MKLFPTTFRYALAASVLALCAFVLLRTDASSQTNSLNKNTRYERLRAAVAANSEAELQKLENAAPGTDEAALARLLRGYLRWQAKDYLTAATLLADETIAKKSELGDYALYYRGQSLQEAGRGEEAEGEFRRLAKKHPTSLLARSAALQAAGAASLRGAFSQALDDLAPLAAADDATALKLKADILQKQGRSNEAVAALRQIYFNAPQSAEAGQVVQRLTLLGANAAPTDAAQLRQRADKLYSAGLYVLAGQAYGQLASQYAAANDETWLRAGASYYKGNSFAQAIAALANVRARTPRAMAEALYYQGAAQIALRNEGQALQTLAQLRQTAPDSPYIAALLYRLGASNEKRNLPTQAAAYYEQLVRQFPQSEHADEAHFWLAWRAHQAKDYPTAARLLTEHIGNYGNTTDNRGKAAFWAAVDNERAGDQARAMTLYRALLKRYGAGWFGVNAERRLALLTSAGVQPKSKSGDAPLARAVEGLQDINKTAETLKEKDQERVEKAAELGRIALHQSALNELEAAREAAPNSPLVNLRIAQIYRQRNENTAAINALKRAYPDYAQALPEEMTREVWDVFYPLGWWSTIKEEAQRRKLDPYFVAGVIRQETIFNPQARSRANAIGLMQLLPSTGQLVARRYSLGNGRLTTADLYNPTLNIQLGTAYLEQMVGEFGRFEYVAAAYNGGPTRVARWRRELPAADIEDWVESIPLSETRLYVQGVYRNTRQYQRLYDEHGRFRSNVPER